MFLAIALEIIGGLVNSKLLLYQVLLKLIRSYGTPLWRRAKSSNVLIIRTLSKWSATTRNNKCPTSCLFRIKHITYRFQRRVHISSDKELQCSICCVDLNGVKIHLHTRAHNLEEIRHIYKEEKWLITKKKKNVEKV